MQSTLIFWPMIIMALVTLGLYLPMSRVRIRSVKEGQVKSSVYYRNIGEPEESMRFSRVIANQYETPILFYAACLTAYVTSNTSTAIIVLAWAFAVVKSAHVAIHVSTNRLRHRQPVFALAFSMLAIMWLVLAGHLAKLF